MNNARNCNLTSRQAEVLGLIRGHLGDNGFPPTRRELARCLGVQTNAIQLHVGALAKKGYIRVVPGAARGLVVTDLGREHAQEGVR